MTKHVEKKWDESNRGTTISSNAKNRPYPLNLSATRNSTIYANVSIIKIPTTLNNNISAHKMDLVYYNRNNHENKTGILLYATTPNKHACIINYTVTNYNTIDPFTNDLQGIYYHSYLQTVEQIINSVKIIKFLSLLTNFNYYNSSSDV
jgi:hypothetical protein